MCKITSFPCHVCGSYDHVLWATALDQFDLEGGTDYVYMQCRSCSLVSLINPPPQDQLADEYPEESYWYDPGSVKSFIAILEEKYREAIFTTEITKAIHFINSGRMLDVGCGSGYVASLYQKHGFTVTGIDISEHALNIARECYGIDCIHGEFSADHFGAGAFDFVNMDYFLEHVPRPMQVLADANRVLRENGLLRMAIPNAESLQFRVFGGRWFNIEAPRHLYIYTPRVIEKMLAINGFRLLHIDHYSVKTNPVVCASSFSKELNPHKLVKVGLPGKLAFLVLTWSCFPFTLLEGLLKKGAAITVFAQKVSEK